MATVTTSESAQPLDGLSLLFAAVMMELTADNFRSRFLGLLPDDWFWADEALSAMGYYVSVSDEYGHD